MKSTWLTRLVVLALMLVAIGGYVYLYSPGSGAPPGQKAAPERAVASVQAPSADASVAPSPQSPPVAVTAAGAPLKSAEVERLRKTGSPVDAYVAYKLIRDCVMARRFEAEIAQDPDPERRNKSASPSAACGDISPGQIVSRLQLLEPAAAAGVHGAALSYAMEGPDGYGIPQDADPNNPALQEWNKRLTAFMDTGAKNGDKWCLVGLAGQYGRGSEAESDFPRALGYWVAYGEIEKVRLGKPSRYVESEVNRLRLKMPAAEAEAAIATGLQIAATAKAEGKQP